jgi:IclR family acetate operon transcriptional repressor
MTTVDNALELLDLFGETQPELGLSDMARLAGRDKATTLRLLSALVRHGLVEKNSVTRLYRLGPGILRLARIREATFPVTSILQPVLEDLTRETGETAHASLLAGDRLVTIGVADSPRAIRVSLEAGLVLPLHATASGIACLAWGGPDLLDRTTAGVAELQRFTDATETGLDRIRARIAEARRTGFAVGAQTFETDVFGIGAPLFSNAGTACGAIAVATPAHRMTDELARRIMDLVTQAAVIASRRMGAEPPAGFLAASRSAA